MPMPENTIHLAGYSYHTKGFRSRALVLPSYLFRLQTEGSCEIGIDDRKTQASAGDLMLLPPGSKYQLTIDEHAPSGDYYLSCEGTWIGEWWSRKKRPFVGRISISESVVSTWRQLILEKRKEDGENTEIIEYLLRVLCLQLDRELQYAAVSGEPRKAFVAYRIKSFLEKNALAPLRLDDVAKHVELSVPRCVQLFKSTFGISMMQYVLDIRMNSAADRLHHSELSIEQIALNCGFGSYSYFHRMFKQRYGITPKEFRKPVSDVD